MQSLGRFNYYDILELKSNAPQHEITTAFERAKSTYTGDNPAIYTIFSELEARQLMVLIEEAYSVLGNKTLRQIYDQRLLGGKSSHEDLSFDSIVLASKNYLPEFKHAEKFPTYVKNVEIEDEIKECSTWNGEFLKKVREYKCFTPEKLYEITKVNPWYITAIEAMEMDRLPATVFVRGYVVQVSKALGLDDKRVVESYMKLYKEKVAQKLSQKSR